MKRGRISSVTNSNVTKTEEISHIQTHQRSLFDLPSDVLVNILQRLSFKRIFVCKCVCKIWCDQISDPEFAKLYADQADVYPLIRTTRRRNGCKVVYLMDPDKDDFERKLRMCNHTFSKYRCYCNVQVKIDNQLEIPLKFGLFKHYKYDLKYGLVHSCNGLLCLSNPSKISVVPPIVWNPITGEFINLPESKKVYSNSDDICYGFGFSPATNQYKVIRMFRKTHVKITVEVHILGTKTWKEIGIFKQLMPNPSSVYFNGFLYWYSVLEPLSIFTFDIENERFGSIPAPEVDQPFRFVSVGVLGVELICMSGIIRSEAIHVWTMKDNGTEKAWSKKFSFVNPIVGDYGLLEPIKYLNDGALLIYHSSRQALVYVDPKRNRFRFFNVGNHNSLPYLEVIAYTPSFVSLKHALSGQNVNVLNVKSRSTKSKLEKEAGVYIVEKRYILDPESRLYMTLVLVSVVVILNVILISVR